jgi:hypothetical protein
MECCNKDCLKGVRQSFGITLHVVVAFCCIALAIMNRVDYLEWRWDSGGDGKAASSPFFHRVVATDFRKQTSEFDAQTRCPLVYGNSTDAGGEKRGVDSLCTCLMRKPRAGSQNAKVQECLEIDGAMPVYVLHYAGVIPSADYVLWAFLCVTASCLTSFSRLDGYPNLRCGLRGILPGVAAAINLIVFSLNIWVWGMDYDGFENEGNTGDRRDVPETCATIRFVFVFIICGYFLHIPHTLTQFNVPGWDFPDGFLMPGYTGNQDFVRYREYMEGRETDENGNFIDPTLIGWNDTKDGKINSYHKIQSSAYACELNQRDEQFRIGFWQAVSEDANFTTGAMLLAVVFSAHAGVHDDSTLLVDVCCVGGVGLLQHMAHVLMLVKEYVYQDSNEEHSFANGIGKDDEMTPDMERRVCEHIGNTRVMIHFFVFSIVVFYCNRASPSTFDDSELKNFFEVARFSVILALLACNTMYDIFFELVHVVKHMTEAGPQFTVNPKDYEEGTQYPAKVSFLAYHAQYRGPYLWRVHLLLPFMLLFAALIYFQQSMRPMMNIDARVGLV